MALIAIVAGLACANAQAGPASDAFAQYVKGFTTLKARFVQTVYTGGDSLEVSEGEVYLARPDRFRWDYSQPYAQSIISDGSTLWIYDQDLEQVTRSTLDKSPDTTPVLLLGSGEDPALHFDLEELGRHGDYDWLSLAPKVADQMYEAIRLGFDSDGLRIMELQDNLGLTTRLQFSDELRDLELSPELFEFDLPPGVDVVEAPSAE
jgi:outer membrane lipoprotein carrier protein